MKIVRLLILFIFIIFCSVIYAQDTENQKEFYFDGVLRIYTGNEEIVAIKNGIEEIGSTAFSENTKITEIILPPSVKCIQDDAFYGCSELTKINLDKVEYIGDSAFYGCSKLENIEFSNKIAIIKKNSFYGCGIEKIKIPSNVLAIEDSAFMNCEKLKILTFDEGILDIGKNAFRKCNRIQDLVFPKTLDNIDDYAFYNCDSIRTITFNLGLEYIGSYAFATENPNKVLKSLSFPYTVQIIYDYAFYNNCGLSSILFGTNEEELKKSKVKNYIVSGIEKIKEGAFKCDDKNKNASLTSVIFPKTLNELGTESFSNYTSITSVTIPQSCNWISAFLGSDLKLEQVHNISSIN